MPLSPNPDPRDADSADDEVSGSLTLEDSVGFRLSRLARVRRDRWATELSSLGLTPPQAAILRATRDTPGQALRALARTLTSDVMAVKRCVDELESRGWVATSTRADDRRVRVVILTDAGAALTGRLDHVVALQESTLRAALTRGQLVALCDALARLERAEGIDEHDDTSEEESEEAR